ncbi:DUF6153 family protein [Nocardioides jensenii]|uniref:DUF6153 family protein n=1 Tax=Nocardioides jensenii TaxID=1843 RepID=UPI000836F027|nr:DUF6153 family protein [Nocardioides jensenii]
MTGHRRQRSALVLATLFAVVFGVFAMHSLTSHERGHAGHAALPLAAEAADREHHTEPAGSKAPESADSESPADDDNSGVAELCMALLCLMAALIALALSRGISRRILYVVVIPRWIGSRIAVLSRSADPPCLHRLSILRC